LPNSLFNKPGVVSSLFQKKIINNILNQAMPVIALANSFNVFFYSVAAKKVNCWFNVA
jgi:hypothetical protein